MSSSFSVRRMRETHAGLQSSAEVFHGWFEDGAPAGFVSHKLIGDTLDVHRVAVHPAFFRRGIARGLLQFVLQLEPSARRAVVQTSRLNDPGRRLYEPLVFEVLGLRAVAPGLSVTLFAKNLRSSNRNIRLLRRLVVPRVHRPAQPGPGSKNQSRSSLPLIGHRFGYTLTLSRRKLHDTQPARRVKQERPA